MMMKFYEHPFIAHRGLHHHREGIPENSLPAFEQAIKCGHGIELDVRLTADGVAIVFHDEHALRMTGKALHIPRTSWAELKSLRLLDTDWGIPTLGQVLTLVGGRVPLVIELKSNTFYGKLPFIVYGLLREYQGRYCIQSFHPGIVLWYQKNAPAVTRGLLGGGRGERNLFSRMAFTDWSLNHLIKPDFCAYHIDQLTQSQVERWKAQGREVAAWTVITAAQMEKAQALCDGIIYEREATACE